ncbi:hypothetical protein RRG08_038696 [Elysia crispata]|uniref:Uncharacterized protein n=1 Tax=Elysia crispata TaxID=231223 RepID=A0AAE0ZJ60_9GAST|nr:hypothetical protein RRG08_038696 [Elysia crispata]
MDYKTVSNIPVRDRVTELKSIGARESLKMPTNPVSRAQQGLFSLIIELGALYAAAMYGRGSICMGDGDLDRPSGLSRQVCNMNGNSVTPPHAGLSRLGQLGLDSGHSIQLAISRHSTDRHSTHYLSLRSSHKVSFSNIFYLLPVCLTEKKLSPPHPPGFSFP